MLAALGLGLLLLSAPPVEGKTAQAERLGQTKQNRQNKQTPMWRDIGGAKVDPMQLAGHKAAVLMFIMTDCPIANSYAPELNRIAADYRDKGVAFYIVYVDTQVSAAAIRKHFHDYGYRCAALMDPEHTLARRAGATISPEAVVIGAHNTIVYRGRIDDRVIDFGKVRHVPNRRDLRLTLDAVLRGDPAPLARTKSVGCYISNDTLTGRKSD